MNPKTLLILCIIITLLTGCRGNLPSQPPPSPEPQSATLTPYASMTPLPTTSSTPTAASPTPTPYPPETKLVSNCLEILPALPEGAKVSGNIVLGSQSKDNPGVFFKNIATGDMVQVVGKDEHYGSMVIAPNRKLMAFMNFGEYWGAVKNLILMNGNGERVKVLPWNESWFNLQAITDEQRLLITYNRGQAEDYPKALVVLDPFTNQQTIIDPVFPDYIKDAYVPYWDGWYGVIYDPTASYAIYPMTMQEGGGEFYTFALWDVLNKQVVGSFEEIFWDAVFSSRAAPMLRWSSDGSMFGLPANSAAGELGEFDLYKVRTDGQAERLTYLSSIAYMRGLTFSWSPDDQKIAMLLDLRPDLLDLRENHLAVLNTQSGVVTDYCVTTEFSYEYAPIWSPDGNLLLLYDIYAEKDPSDENDSDLQSRVVLVDIAQGFAAVIAEDMLPMGWLASTN